MAAKAAEEETVWISVSALPKVPVVVPITAFLHVEAKHSHRTTLAIGVSTDTSITGYKHIHLVPSLSFYKNPFINPQAQDARDLREERQSLEEVFSSGGPALGYVHLPVLCGFPGARVQLAEPLLCLEPSELLWALIPVQRGA